MRLSLILPRDQGGLNAGRENNKDQRVGVAIPTTFLTQYCYGLLPRYHSSPMPLIFIKLRACSDLILSPVLGLKESKFTIL